MSREFASIIAKNYVGKCVVNAHQCLYAPPLSMKDEKEKGLKTSQISQFFII
jgi:hypothetical protein